VKDEREARDDRPRDKGNREHSTSDSRDIQEQLRHVVDQIAAIKAELAEKTHYLRICGTLADLFAAKNELEAKLDAGGTGGTENDPIDGSMVEYLMGYQAYQDGDFEEAEAYFSTSIDRLEWNLLARLNLGNLHFVQGAHDKAEIVFTEALAFAENGARSEVLTNLGMNAVKQDKLMAAENFFRQAIDIDPGNALALNDMGLVKDMQESEEEALQYYERAIRADPSDCELWYNLGTVLGKLGNKEGRLFCFMKAEERGFAELREMIDDLVDQGIKPKSPLQ
jgi:Tfp pilus assembly protein PilF